MTMKSTGSCIAVYPLHLTDDVLGVIKELRELDYSDRQLTVIGEWSMLNEGGSDEFSLFNKFKNVGLSDIFWDELEDLLEGKVLFQIPDSGSLTVVGGLSSKVFNKSEHETDAKKNIKNKSEDKAGLEWLFDLVGIPECSFKYYETTLKTGLLILIAFGSHKEVEDAGDLLDLSRSIDVSLHLTSSN